MSVAKLIMYTTRLRQSKLLAGLGHTLCFVVLVAGFLRYPSHPSFGLDASWQMALGQLFHNGRQFGPEVAFTFGPLGFLPANTYMGVHFWSLVVWNGLAAVVVASLIVESARLQRGMHRLIHYGSLLFCSIAFGFFESVYSMTIALIGFRLLRCSRERWRPVTVLLMLFLALLANMKFPYLLLASFAVLVVCVQELSQGRWYKTLCLGTCFLAGFLAVWMACGQSLGHLPVYLYNSWHISQGYEQAMGLPTSERTFWLGIAVLILLAAYALLYLVRHCGQSRALARLTLLAAFLYLAWKHGFVRSDTHVLIFFISALLPIVTFPVLLDDPPPQRWPAQLLLGLAGVLCLWGIHHTFIKNRWPSPLWHIPSQFQETFRRHAEFLGQWPTVHRGYQQVLAKQKKQYDLPQTREVVGQAAIDVLGYDQAIALYNGFTYLPRPIFQSYSAYTPHLARLNDAFYRSNQAPAYALLKIQTIDQRFPTLDDSLLLRSFMYRHEYIHTEGGFQLWKRRVQPSRDASELTGSLRRETVTFTQPLHLGRQEPTRLWATFHLQPSMLGRLRNALYKPPIVKLALQDRQGQRSTFRLTVSQAATGFILNPIIENSNDYVCFAMGAAGRQISTLALEVRKQDRKFFTEPISLELWEWPSPSGAQDCHEQLIREQYFWMFRSYPLTYAAPHGLEEVRIDDRAALKIHAPSTLEFVVPQGATSISGAFGFVEAAYTGKGLTDGATFRILWQDNQGQGELYQRSLDPRTVPADRGLQPFQVTLTGLAAGTVVLQIDPGVTADWDWTAWTAISIE